MPASCLVALWQSRVWGSHLSACWHRMFTVCIDFRQAHNYSMNSPTRVSIFGACLFVCSLSCGSFSFRDVKNAEWSEPKRAKGTWGSLGKGLSGDLRTGSGPKMLRSRVDQKRLSSEGHCQGDWRVRAATPAPPLIPEDMLSLDRVPLYCTSSCRMTSSLSKASTLLWPLALPLVRGQEGTQGLTWGD